jgi:hypothetical protein
MRQSLPSISNAIALLVSSVISARAAGTVDGTRQVRPKPRTQPHRGTAASSTESSDNDC